MSVEKLRTLHIAWLHRKVMVEDFRTQYAFFNGHAIDCTMRSRDPVSNPSTPISMLTTKVSRGNSECRIIRNGSGIDLGYYKTTDRLDILFHHKVAAGVGFIISTSFAAGRCPSQRRAKKC